MIHPQSHIKETHFAVDLFYITPICHYNPFFCIFFCHYLPPPTHQANTPVQLDVILVTSIRQHTILSSSPSSSFAHRSSTSITSPIIKSPHYTQIPAISLSLIRSPMLHFHSSAAVKMVLYFSVKGISSHHTTSLKHIIFPFPF